jgi:MinD-like ATPase involved in chromosome partitioning or flagellar assembly
MDPNPYGSSGQDATFEPAPTGVEQSGAPRGNDSTGEATTPTEGVARQPPSDWPGGTPASVRSTRAVPPASAPPAQAPQRRPPTRAIQPWESSPFGHSPRPGPNPGSEPVPAPPARPDLSRAVYPNAGQWERSGEGGPSANGPQFPTVYQIETAGLIQPVREIPRTGWRKVVYDASFNTVNLGPSPTEQRLNAQRQLVATPITGTYQIAVLGIKGGVGKTRTTAALGTVFATHRTEPVITIDASPTYGGLGPVVDPSAPSSMREWNADPQLITYPAARRHTGKNRQGLEVLGGNQNLSSPLMLEADTFDAALARSQQFYQLSLIDCGSDIDHPVMPAVLSAASALVIVATMQAEHARAAGQTVQWLASRGANNLLRRTVVVINDAFDNSNKEFVANLTEQFAPYVQAVMVVPWDPHVRDAVTLDFDSMRRRTQLAYLEVAAELATGFRPSPPRRPTEPDRR